MFQDFGPLTERRRLERQQRRKRLIIAGVSGVIFLLLVVVGALATLHVSAGADSSSVRMPASATPTKELHSTSRAIKMICSSTDYKSTCVSSLSKAFNSSSKLQPRDLIKAAVAVVSNEVAQGFSHSDLIKSDDPKVKGAIEDCKELYNYAKDELERTADGVGMNVLQQLPKREHDLKNWLSAVMSYQQTCIDGFPEGEFKTNMNKAMKTAKELTSNALAIISEASSLLSSLDIQGLAGLGRRRLLSKEEGGGDCPGCQASVHKNGFPAWVSDADRRLLKQDQAKKLKPNVVVAKDGSGNFKTISGALAAMPAKYKGRYVIYVKAGVYDESPTVTKKMVNVTMYGDGSRKTIVNGNKNFVDGTRTFQTATFVAIGEGFMAIAMGFRNSAGAIKHQAVALRVQSDRSIFLNCRMEGYQDTLYAQTHRQYYRSCVIAGTVDFIFGDAAAIFQNCNLVVRRPLDNQQNIVTAQGRVDRRESTGFVIHNCRFIADKKLKALGAPPIRSYLGRPWKEYSRTIIMESTIGDFIHTDGYMPWEGDFALKTLYYGEYGNKGPGARLAKRVSWPGFRVIKKQEAFKYTVASFIQGGDWIKATGTPVHLGLYN